MREALVKEATDRRDGVELPNTRVIVAATLHASSTGSLGIVFKQRDGSGPVYVEAIEEGPNNDGEIKVGDEIVSVGGAYVRDDFEATTTALTEAKLKGSDTFSCTVMRSPPHAAAKPAKRKAATFAVEVLTESDEAMPKTLMIDKGALLLMVDEEVAKDKQAASMPTGAAAAADFEEEDATVGSLANTPSTALSPGARSQETSQRSRDAADRLQTTVREKITSFPFTTVESWRATDGGFCFNYWPEGVASTDADNGSTTVQIMMHTPDGKEIAAACEREAAKLLRAMVHKDATADSGSVNLYEGVADADEEDCLTLLQETHTSWTMQEVQVMTTIAKILHGLHSALTLFKAGLSIVQPVIEALPVPFIEAVTPFMGRMSNCLFHWFKVWFLFFSKPHSVLIEAKAPDGKSTRYLASDDRPLSQRICSGFIGWPMALYRIASLDGDAPRTILRVRSTRGRYILQTASGTVVAQKPMYLAMTKTEKVAHTKVHRGSCLKRVFLVFDAGSENSVAVFRLLKKGCRRFVPNVWCGSGEPPPNLVKRVKMNGSSPLLSLGFTTSPIRVMTDYCYPALMDLADEVDSVDGSDRVEQAESAHELAADALELAKSVTDIKKALKGEIERYKVIGTSKTTFKVDTADMSELQKAAVLLFTLQFEFAVHRVH